MSTDLQKTLAEICADFFPFVIQVRVTKPYKDRESLFKEIQRRLDIIERTAQKNDIPSQDIQDVKYALCALLDQMILTSDCLFKDEWASHPLELEYFGQNIAGVEFFKKLEEIRMQLETRTDVLEVYYYCLVNGFEGKYRIESKENLKQLIDNLSADLRRIRRGSYDKLSVQWELPQSLMQKVSAHIPPWIFGVAALFLVFIIFTILRALIGNEATKLNSELVGILSKL